MSNMSDLDQAVIDAADAMLDDLGDIDALNTLYEAIRARREALKPKRRTWTITTEYRKPVMGAVPYEQHITSAGRFDCGNYNSPCHVVVSVEPAEDDDIDIQIPRPPVKRRGHVVWEPNEAAVSVEPQP